MFKSVKKSYNSSNFQFSDLSTTATPTEIDTLGFPWGKQQSKTKKESKRAGENALWRIQLVSTVCIPSFSAAQSRETDPGDEKRGMIRTYGRKRAAEPEHFDDEEDMPRKRIRMDKRGMVVIEGGEADNQGEEGKSEEAIMSGGEVSSSTARRAAGSSTAPSSPPPPSLFSDARARDCEGSSPPSSPPPVAARLPFPPPPTRKPTFAFLKRKRSSRDEDLAEASGKPLGDIAHNLVRGGTQATKKPRLTQMQIDLGGEVRRTCERCEMEYIPSNKGDTAVHEAFHDLHLHGVDLGKVFVKDRSLKRLRSTRKTLELHEDIIVVDRRNSDKVKRQAKLVLEVVNSDLSAPNIEDEQLWGALESTSVASKRGNLKKRKAKKEAPDTKGDRFKMFMYLVNGRCAGFCLAEKISSAFKVVDSHTELNETNISAPSSSSISISSKSDVALLGISRIWTSKSFRLQSIATDLLDCARNHFFYGMELTKDLVAFSQPTESGRRLAESWFGTKIGWHVYTEPL